MTTLANNFRPGSLEHAIFEKLAASCTRVRDYPKLRQKVKQTVKFLNDCGWDRICLVKLPLKEEHAGSRRKTERLGQGVRNAIFRDFVNHLEAGFGEPYNRPSLACRVVHDKGGDSRFSCCAEIGLPGQLSCQEFENAIQHTWLRMSGSSSRVEVTHNPYSDVPEPANLRKFFMNSAGAQT